MIKWYLYCFGGQGEVTYIPTLDGKNGWYLNKNYPDFEEFWCQIRDFVYQMCSRPDFFNVIVEATLISVLMVQFRGFVPGFCRIQIPEPNFGSVDAITKLDGMLFRVPNMLGHSPPATDLLSQIQKE